MRVAIDTNRLSDFFRGDDLLAARLETYEEIYIPLPVLAELRVGFMMGGKRLQNESALKVLLRKPGIEVLTPSVTTATYYASLVVGLRAAGTPIPINDVWIAALVLEHDLTLITRDKHFERIPQLLLTDM